MAAKSRKQQIEEMLAAEPNDVELRYMLALEHVSLGDDEGAVRVFHELFAVAPDYPIAMSPIFRSMPTFETAWRFVNG